MGKIKINQLGPQLNPLPNQIKILQQLQNQKNNQNGERLAHHNRHLPLQ